MQKSECFREGVRLGKTHGQGILLHLILTLTPLGWLLSLPPLTGEETETRLAGGG